LLRSPSTTISASRGDYGGPISGRVGGHIGKEDYQRERAAIEAELAKLRDQPAVPTVRQFSARISDLVVAWKDATSNQRPTGLEHPVRDTGQRSDHNCGPAPTRLGPLLRGAASRRCVLGAGDDGLPRGFRPTCCQFGTRSGTRDQLI